MCDIFTLISVIRSGAFYGLLIQLTVDKFHLNLLHFKAKFMLYSPLALYVCVCACVRCSHNQMDWISQDLSSPPQFLFLITCPVAPVQADNTLGEDAQREEKRHTKHVILFLEAYCGCTLYYEGWALPGFSSATLRGLPIVLVLLFFSFLVGGYSCLFFYICWIAIHFHWFGPRGLLVPKLCTAKHWVLSETRGWSSYLCCNILWWPFKIEKGKKIKRGFIKS